MFTTIRRYSVKPGQMEATIERVRAGLVPIISKQQGFISYHALDAGDNVAVSVSCYYSRAMADAANTEAAAWAQSNLSRLQPIDVTVGEVLVEASADTGDARSHLPT
jgi:heme-degrading monooxygenase HmoA